MKVSEALKRRSSIRAFTNRLVDEQLIRSVLERAARSPSGGNLQPWKIYIPSEAKHKQLCETMSDRLANSPEPDLPAQYAIYPENLKSPHRDYRYQLGMDLYKLLEIGRDDHEGRARQFANNYQFFGARNSLFCFVDKQMGPPQWSDLGMYLQSVMLLFQEEGVDTCAQECWSVYHKTVSDLLGVPNELMLFCGMSIGYRSEDDRVNQLVAQRAPLDAFATFVP